MIILLAKSYIFWASRTGRNPNIILFQKRFWKTFQEQKCLAMNRDKLDNFTNKWDFWITLVPEDMQ